MKAVRAGALFASLTLAACLPGNTSAPGSVQGAQDASARADLNVGVRVGAQYLAEHGSWVGFTASAATALTEGVRWQDGGDPGPGVLAITEAGAALHMITRAESGRYWCAHAAGDPPVYSHGFGGELSSVDTAEECNTPGA